MTPEFAELVNPVFDYVLDLLSRVERTGSIKDIREERRCLRELLDEGSQAVKHNVSRVRADDYELAKRALVYWIDEVLTRADRRWTNSTLEFEYYGTINRAYLFYVEGHREALNSTADVIEIWYLALVLGFKGDIRDAFLQQMNAAELPGRTDDPEAARRAFTESLGRKIKRTTSRELPPVQIVHDVAPLVGGKRLSTALPLFLMSAVIFGVATYYFWGDLFPASETQSRQSSTVSE